MTDWTRITELTTLGELQGILDRHGLRIAKLHRSLGRFVVRLEPTDWPHGSIGVLGGGASLAEAIDDGLTWATTNEGTVKR
jgi:hypothetical protein